MSSLYKLYNSLFPTPEWTKPTSILVIKPTRCTNF